MNIAIGSDHGGVELKAALVNALAGAAKVVDMGPADKASCDYPDYAAKVAKAVASGEADFGRESATIDNITLYKENEATAHITAYVTTMHNNPTDLYINTNYGLNTDGTVKEAWDALEARELIKCSVQREAPVTAREACQELCEKVHAAPVQCIGSKFSIYRPRRKDPTIELPR